MKIDHRIEDHPGPTGVGFRFEWEKVFRDAKQGLRVAGLGLVLATYGLEDGTCIHPGNTRMAWECGQGRIGTARSLVRLRKRGWIAVTHEATATSPTVYRLTLPSVA